MRDAQIPAPVFFDKDLGRPVHDGGTVYTTSDSEGNPVTPLTQEQKYTFDTRGWLLMPGVLSEDEAGEMREWITRIHKEPETVPEHDRTPLAGPTQRLIDHPAAIAFCQEFVYMPYRDGGGASFGNEDTYGFRLEMCAYRHRDAGGGFGPHNGNGMMRLPGDAHEYRCFPGKAHAGMVRAIWELSEVKHGTGGTILISGSHKAAFTAPESVYSPDSPLWDTYGCPAGSVLFFTEATTHSATNWTNPDNPRVAVLNSYNTVCTKWHDWDPDPVVVEQMPAKRRTLFRPVNVAGNFAR